MKSSPLSDIVFFDGICALCHWSVRWIVKRDSKKVFSFAPLQGSTAKKLLDPLYLSHPESIVYLHRDMVYTQSTAVLHIVRKLPFAWRMLYVLILIPRPIRDGVYNFIAKNRYRWFGKLDQCSLPTSDTKARFLE
jgi:predicted DCC family thiol-disulfide oxidoreductase YuxK